MPTYQYAIGYNNTAGYAAFDTLLGFDPYCPGITDGRRLIGGDGMIYADGSDETDLRFGFLTKEQHSALLSALGITTAASAQITISLPLNNGRTFDDFNAIVVRPNLPEDGRFERSRYLDINLHLQKIVAI
jgi:hypothetical protein